MPNARSKDQTLLAFTLDQKLADVMDSVSSVRGENRSEFIRRALVNYLRELGHPVADSLSRAPDRRALPALRVAEDTDAPAAVPVKKLTPAEYKKSLAATLSLIHISEPTRPY